MSSERMATLLLAAAVLLPMPVRALAGGPAGTIPVPSPRRGRYSIITDYDIVVRNCRMYNKFRSVTPVSVGLGQGNDGDDIRRDWRDPRGEPMPAAHGTGTEPRRIGTPRRKVKPGCLDTAGGPETRSQPRFNPALCRSTKGASSSRFSTSVELWTIFSTSISAATRPIS